MYSKPLGLQSANSLTITIHNIQYIFWTMTQSPPHTIEKRLSFLNERRSRPFPTVSQFITDCIARLIQVAHKHPIHYQNPSDSLCLIQNALLPLTKSPPPSTPLSKPRKPLGKTNPLTLNRDKSHQSHHESDPRNRHRRIPALNHRL